MNIEEKLIKKWITTIGSGPMHMEVLSDLLSRYKSRCRYYHDLSHIEDLFYHLDIFFPEYTDDISLHLAIWFHDSIQWTFRCFNELASARLARQQLLKLNLSEKTIKEVEKLILVTGKHKPLSNSYKDKIMLDLDLRILASDPKEYSIYTKNIYREIPWWAKFRYRSARLKFLRNKIGTKLFYTDQLSYLELKAKRNMQNEIKKEECSYF